jgi:predicted metal-dependent phosphoesterase TrpH
MRRRFVSAFLTASLLLGVCWLAAWTGAEPAPEKAAGPTWWKGNMHTHTLWSDGDDFAENVAGWYRDHGYHFLALTDHNKLSEGRGYVDVTRAGHAIEKARKRFGEDAVQYVAHEDKVLVKLRTLEEIRKQFEQPGKFLLVQAEEITGSYSKSPIHMNGINLDKAIQPLTGQNHEETIRVNLRQVADQAKARKKPMLAVLNHPNFGWGVRAEDMAGIDELEFFEVYNGHSGVRNYGDETHASTERIWDIVLALRLGKLKLPLLRGLATDDSHAYHTFAVGKTNPGRGWVMVRSEKLAADDLVRAIQAGDFYSSTGVVLNDFRVEQGEVIGTLQGTPLDSEPVRDPEGKELAVTRKYSDQIGKVLAKSNAEEVRYKFSGKELYVRVRVTSSKPHANPYAKGDFEMAWVPPVVP